MMLYRYIERDKKQDAQPLWPGVLLSLCSFLFSFTTNFNPATVLKNVHFPILAIVDKRHIRRHQATAQHSDYIVPEAQGCR